MRECRVYVLSSHPLFAAGLTSILAQDRKHGVRVIGSGKSLARDRAEIAQLNPDVILCDTEVLRRLRGEQRAALGAARVVEVDLRESRLRVDGLMHSMRDDNDLIDAVASGCPTVEGFTPGLG